MAGAGLTRLLMVSPATVRSGTPAQRASTPEVWELKTRLGMGDQV